MDNLAKLKVAVFAKQKILAKIYAQSAGQSLYKYANSWLVSPPSQNTQTFFGQAQKLLLKVYPPELASGVLKQAGQSPLVSTIDHHGILSHPFFINSNLIFSQRQGLKYLLCFSTASVSLNNSSWPGCLLITADDGQLKRFSFFPDKVKNSAVLGTRAFDIRDVKRISGHIKAANFLAEHKKRQLLGLIEEIFNRPQVFGFSDFSGQAAFISNLLWAKVFPDAPRLLYLPLEELVSALVVDEIATDQNNILYKLFFTPEGWDSVEKYFHGSLGAFFGAHKGSFLFWGLKNGRRAHLARKGELLEDRDFSVPADVGFITGMLEAKELYPTTLMCFLVLLYYGATCLGGFNQVNWLTDTKEKFANLLEERGEQDLAKHVAKIPTENFAEGSLAFGADMRGRIYKPTVLDLFLQNDGKFYEKYTCLASRITVGESIVSQLPEIYKVITPARERVRALLKISEADIAEQTGLAGKIKSALIG